MDEDVPLPFLLVEVLPYDCLLLCSPVCTSIVTIKEGNVLHSISHASTLQAPRCLAVSALSDVASSSTKITATHSDADCLIAQLDDEKSLIVYKVNGLSQRNVIMEEVFSAALPKRGVKMQWESDAEDMRLVIGDRHGDVRSFLVCHSSDSNEHKAKKQKMESQLEGKDIKGDDEGLDLTNPPHLGHASMLTDFILTSFTDQFSQSPAKFIITSDRDEHIRISRWGKRRAGHLALRYLLGSQEAIGGLCVLEHKHLETLRGSSTPETTKAYLSSPLLFSTDASRLHVWSLHRDSEISDDRPDSLIDIDLEENIRPYIKVDPKLERTRERTFAKGVSKSRKRQEQGLDFVEHIGRRSDELIVLDCPIIIKQLYMMQVHDQVYLTFLVDGSSALYSINLKKFLADSTNVVNYLSILDLGTPILDSAYYMDGEERLVWTTHDIRHPQGQEYNDTGLKLARFDTTLKRWIPASNHKFDILHKQHSLQSKSTSHIANSLLLYDALCLYPKQDFELATNMKDAIAPNGLIRGGLANFERLGLNTNSTTKSMNGGNNERNILKKVQMRQDMLKRIEKSLGEREGASS